MMNLFIVTLLVMNFNAAMCTFIEDFRLIYPAITKLKKYLGALASLDCLSKKITSAIIPLAQGA